MRFAWPWISSSQVGEVASSKSAMNTFAPELSALISILALVGPVISTRRSCRSAGMRPDRPVGLADVARVLAEVGKLARVEALLPVEPPVEQLAAARIESFVQLGDEVEGIRGQDCACPGNSAWLGHDPWPIDH